MDIKNKIHEIINKGTNFIQIWKLKFPSSEHLLDLDNIYNRFESAYREMAKDSKEDD